MSLHYFNTMLLPDKTHIDFEVSHSFILLFNHTLWHTLVLYDLSGASHV